MAKTYSEIQNIQNPKDKLFAIIDRMEELEGMDFWFSITGCEKLELENLQVLKMQSYSDWKD